MTESNYLTANRLLGSGLHQLRADSGSATAEYAIATMAAVGFAGLLVVIMRSPEVRDLLLGLVRSALTFQNPNG